MTARCAFCLTAAGGRLSCARCAAPIHPGCALEHAACPACHASIDLSALAAALSPDDGWEVLGPGWEPSAFVRSEADDEGSGEVRLRLEVERVALAAGSLLPVAVRVSGSCARSGPLELRVRRPASGRWPLRRKPVDLLELRLGAEPRLAPGRWAVRLALRGIAPGPLEVVARLARVRASATVPLQLLDPCVSCAAV